MNNMGSNTNLSTYNSNGGFEPAVGNLQHLREPKLTVLIEITITTTLHSVTVAVITQK